jgi:hypothetical protein
VGTHEAKGDGEHFLNISHGDSGSLTSIRGQPKEDSVDATDTQLQTGNGHGESSLSAGGVQCKLVGNIVLFEIKRVKSR